MYFSFFFFASSLELIAILCQEFDAYTYTHTDREREREKGGIILSCCNGQVADNVVFKNTTQIKKNKGIYSCWPDVRGRKYTVYLIRNFITKIQETVYPST